MTELLYRERILLISLAVSLQYTSVLDSAKRLRLTPARFDLE